ncbi:MAG: radical SAM protein [archaeon GB-1867-005]|nr:radical SAM protein [Candidatus Culexmicrobium cathedralense]
MISLLVWLCTYNCNLNCTHCYIKGRSSNEINTENAMRLISQVAEIMPRHFSISGGEPLTRKDIFKLLEACQSYMLNTSIVTNGMLLGEAEAEKLAKLDIHVYISLDAATKETASLIRGVKAWNSALKAIKNMSKAGVKFSTIMTITPENYLEAGKFVELSAEVKASHASLIPMIPSGAAAKRELKSHQLLMAFRQAEEKADELGFPISFWCSPYLKWIKKSKYIYIGGCPDNAIDIDPEGNTLLCDVLQIKINNALKLGLKRAIKEYMSHPISQMFKNPSALKGKCKNCQYKEKCGGGCRARAYLKSGDFFSSDPLCPLTKQA